jgi:hypothetical protein
VQVIIVFSILAVVLFAAAFVTKRRFGLLGLALAAGSILSEIWNTDAGLIVSATGLVPRGPLTDTVTLSLLVLLPPIILLFHGTTYKTVIPRIFGSLLFALLALAFLVQPLQYSLVLDGFGAEAFRWLEANRVLIISIGMVIAVVDLFLTNPAHMKEKRKR